MRPILWTVAALMMIVMMLACSKREDDFITDGSVELQFSLDTLRFDTVFTEVGSATRSFKVINPNKQPVRLGRAYIEGGDASFFRMNVDGIAGDVVEDIEIWGQDSIYVFVEVTIDPDQPLSISPFVIDDHIIFETNDRRQSVRLEAWGQNANYFPSRFNRGVPTLLTCDNGTVVWDDPKPYVIYGELLIDSCALEVMAGTRIHVHGGIARNDLFGIFNDGILYTLQNGRLRFLGTEENPVVIQGDRLEEEFAEEPGQWFGIVLGRGSNGNRFEHTVIKNSNIGIFVDSLADVTALNTEIANTAGNGIAAFHSRVVARNCLIYNNASNSVQLTLGGDYFFDHCTIASYGVNAAAISMSNFFCYDDDPLSCNQAAVNRLRAIFRNSIFFGSRRDQVLLSDYSARMEPDMFDVSFRNCVVRTERLLTDNDGLYADFFESYCQDCVNGTTMDPLFISTQDDDYHLDTLSIAKDVGVPLQGLDVDLDGVTRDDLPDAGCYERVE
ncbi:right-handed parallel beta-helix repeat-containing protein [Flavilitoribacter nigricans]|uniref:Right handed beta helix domain-containing protein n=1 Tax=Flavilitoribacter nigricans (strain ATCC 23147 / DSM 23189 / NBRC 102662 / NCIMB 1420 / SS-2) TaxID=1122177 RepID=A0A2D0NCW1_FLAN2|nr:right-handed parallel beta-helix repeat-containing protein [Flavilitoribacter nigricans]PHN06019.1 hypothetical protein CRP01_13700 [Flavilitoribacter nigricans DSM 23189 = NBRC 102662]